MSKTFKERWEGKFFRGSISVRLGATHQEELQYLSEKLGITRSQVIRTAIREKYNNYISTEVERIKHGN